MDTQKIYCEECKDESDDCQECCPHDDHDHGICIDCGKDNYDSLIGDSDYLQD